MTHLADAPPQVRPLERHAQMETDHFCDCGYNLHGQIVTRDERLGFMVCRCPECGRWHPAGEGTSARRVWLNRIGLFALFSWIIFATCIVLSLLLAMGGMQGFQAAVMVKYVQSLPDGTPVEYEPQQGQWINTATGQPIAINPAVGFPAIQYRQALRTEWDRGAVMGIITVNVVSVLLATALGGFVAIAAWHVRRWRHCMAAGLPILVAFVVYWIWSADPSNDPLRLGILPWLAWCVALQVIFVLFGILIGRPVARGLARLFVPPKPRQALAFLWRADGKTPPAS